MVPALSDLLNLAICVEAHNVNLPMSAPLVEPERTTYNWECNNSISEKVIIQVWQICSTSHEKLYCSMDLDRERVSTFNHREVFFLLLLEIAGLVIEVLDDFGGAIDGNESGNVIERRVAG